MIGQVFGRLTVTALSHTRNGNRYWLCSCECGGSVTVKTGSLNYGSTKSCGCGPREAAKSNGLKNKKHGMSRHPLDNVFDMMKRRCFKPTDKRYENYGGKGVTICSEWLNDRSKFFDWALANGYKKGLTIDRIDVNGDYSPENCRFVDCFVQMNNTTRNRFVTWQGKTLTVAQWARELGVREQALQHRFTRNWPIEKIFTQPFRGRKLD